MKFDFVEYPAAMLRDIHFEVIGYPSHLDACPFKNLLTSHGKD